MTLLTDAAGRSAIGAATRIEAPDKVSGKARYAFEHPIDDVAYVWPVQSTIAKGEIRTVDAEAALALPRRPGGADPGQRPSAPVGR